MDNAESRFPQGVSAHSGVNGNGMGGELEEFFLDKRVFAGEIHDVATRFRNTVGGLREAEIIWEHCQDEARKKRGGDVRGLFCWSLKDTGRCKDLVEMHRRQRERMRQPVNVAQTDEDLKVRMWTMYYHREIGSYPPPHGELMNTSLDGLLTRIAREFGWTEENVYDVLDGMAKEVTQRMSELPFPLGIRDYHEWTEACRKKIRQKLQGLAGHEVKGPYPLRKLP